MKIVKASAGLLTNFEVLDFLRNKGDSPSVRKKLSEIKSDDLKVGEDDQSERIKRNLTLSEMKVYEYLVKTAARDQTRECVSEFLQRCKKYQMAQADVLPIVNIRPSEPSATVELYSVSSALKTPFICSPRTLVESFFERFENQADEILQMIEEVLPPRPVAKKDDEKEDLVPFETSNQAATETQQDGPRPEPMIED